MFGDRTKRSANHMPGVGGAIRARLVRRSFSDASLAAIGEQIVASARAGQFGGGPTDLDHSPSRATAGLRQRSVPIDLNLLTAMAPRSFRAFEPGAANTVNTAARSAS